MNIRTTMSFLVLALLPVTGGDTLSAIDAHIDGSAAWAMFDYHIAGKTEKPVFDSVGIGTAILQKRAGTRRIVHWHSTKAPNQ